MDKKDSSILFEIFEKGMGLNSMFCGADTVAKSVLKSRNRNEDGHGSVDTLLPFGNEGYG